REKRTTIACLLVSVPTFKKEEDETKAPKAPFISSIGLMRHTSLTTGLAVIQPVIPIFFVEARAILGMKVLREEVEKLAWLLKREKDDNEEYARKNIQLEREVEALQGKLRDAQEKVDKLERIFTHLKLDTSESRTSDRPPSPSARNEMEMKDDNADLIGARSTNMSMAIHPSDSLSLEIPKTDQLIVDLQKENMKLQYMKEMHEEKIHSLTQVNLFFVYLFQCGVLVCACVCVCVEISLFLVV
ncbi:hypothetical protein RFI_03342, partial [Reticulomyxa filosa]